MDNAKTPEMTPRTMIEKTLMFGNVTDTVRVTRSARKLLARQKRENQDTKSSRNSLPKEIEPKLPVKTPRTLIANILDTDSVDQTIRPNLRPRKNFRESNAMEQDADSTSSSMSDIMKIVTKKVRENKTSIKELPPRKKKRLSEINVNTTIAPDVAEFAEKLSQGITKTKNKSIFLSPQSSQTPRYQEIVGNKPYTRAKRHSLDNMLSKNSQPTPQSDKFFTELMNKMRLVNEKENDEEFSSNLNTPKTSMPNHPQEHISHDKRSASSISASDSNSSSSKHQFFSDLIDKMTSFNENRFISHGENIREVDKSKEEHHIPSEIDQSDGIPDETSSIELVISDPQSDVREHKQANEANSSVTIKLEPAADNHEFEDQQMSSMPRDTEPEVGFASVSNKADLTPVKHEAEIPPMVKSSFHDTIPSPFIHTQHKPALSLARNIESDTGGTPSESAGAGYSSPEEAVGVASAGPSQTKSFFTMQTPKVDRHSVQKFDAILHKYFDKTRPTEIPQTKVKKPSAVAKPKLNLPCSSSQIRDVLKHHTTLKIQPAALDFMVKASELYMKRTGEKLGKIVKADKKKIIKEKHVAKLMKKRKYITDETPLRILIEQNLPYEYRELLIPMAVAGKKIFPAKTLLSKEHL